MVFSSTMPSIQFFLTKPNFEFKIQKWFLVLLVAIYTFFLTKPNFEFKIQKWFLVPLCHLYIFFNKTKF